MNGESYKKAGEQTSLSLSLTHTHTLRAFYINAAPEMNAQGSYATLGAWR